MSQCECISTRDLLCCTSDRAWDESLGRGLIQSARGALRTLGQLFRDWHTGHRSADLIDSLNEQQLRDIGMAGHKRKRDAERIRLENHPWHLPLL